MFFGLFLTYKSIMTFLEHHVNFMPLGEGHDEVGSMNVKLKVDFLSKVDFSEAELISIPTALSVFPQAD